MAEEVRKDLSSEIISPLARHFPTLDGLRGVAIGMVLCNHFGSALGETGWEGVVRSIGYQGYLGVDLFFVLSGFLITRILVETRGDPSFLATFYARRSLRIFPVYYAYLAVVFCLYHPYLRAKVGGTEPSAASAWWPILYLGNLEMVRSGTDGGAGLSHLWSLCVEEHFYLIWPIAIALIARRKLILVCFVGVALAVLCRTWLAASGVRHESIYMLSPARIDALLAGAAVGIWETTPDSKAVMARACRPIIICLMPILAAIAATGGFGLSRVVVVTFGWSASAIFFAAIVAWLVTTERPTRLLASRPLRRLGRLSYGIYLWHMLTIPLANRIFGRATTGARLSVIAAEVAISIVLAQLSWKFIETPALTFKRHFRYGRPITPRSREYQSSTAQPA